MKRFLQIFAVMLIVFVVYSASSQTLVSTDPQPRNAVLEEFTGIYCGFCPDGHVRAKALMDQYPGRFIAINIHNSDSYSKPKQSTHPDFRTALGPAIEQLCGSGGYPGGTVSRQSFTGSQYSVMTAGTMRLGRGGWQYAVADVINDPSGSPINIGAKTKWNESTKTLEVIVEAYFTRDAGQNVKLNVALLQNHVFGYQGSGGEQYDHQHIFRDMLTGQWGEEITTTTNGTLFSKTFTYSFEGKNWADVNSTVDLFGKQFNIENCEIVIFATQADNKFIYTGISIPAITPNLVLNNTGENGDALNTGENMTNVIEVSNNTETEISFNATVELSERTPDDWEGSIVGNSDFKVSAGEKVNVEFKFVHGKTLGIGDATLKITEVDVENPLSYTTKVTLVSNEIEKFEVIPDDEKQLSILKYIPNGNSIFQIPDKDFGLVSSKLTNTKLLIWNTGYAGEHDDNSLKAISSAVNGDVKVFLTGAQSLSTMTNAAIAELMIQYIGYSIEGYQQGVPSPWTATLAGIDGDDISGSYTSGISTGWSYYPYYCYDSFNDSKAKPFLGFKNPQTIYLSSTNYKTVQGDAANIAFKITKNNNRAVLFGMDVFFIKDETIREKLIENAYNWLVGTVDVPENMISKGSLAIAANPNPVDNYSTITYSVSKNQNVRISLYNELGQEVALVFEGNVEAGSHVAEFEAASLSSGSYYMVMKSGLEVISIPVAIVK